MNKLAVIGLAVLCGGCATMKDGAEQAIEISSDPAGASIKIEPDGMSDVTPTTVKLDFRFSGVGHGGDRCIR